MSDWRLTPQNTALVVVDVQEKLLSVMARRAEILAGVQKLLGAAKVLNLPVIMTAQYVKGLGPVCAEVAGPPVIEKLAFSCCGAPEFVRAVRAKGLPEALVISHHILRVGLLPVVAVIALQAGFLLSGTVITESLFVRPGIGTLLLNATRSQDYPVVQGLVILAAAVYILLNSLTVALYRVIDPRVSVS